METPTQGEMARRGLMTVLGAIDAVEAGGEPMLHQYGTRLLDESSNHDELAATIQAAINVTQAISLFLASTLLVQKLNERRPADAPTTDGPTQQNQSVS